MFSELLIEVALNWCLHLVATGEIIDYGFSLNVPQQNSLKILDYISPNYFETNELPEAVDESQFEIPANPRQPPSQLEALLYLIPTSTFDSYLNLST